MGDSPQAARMEGFLVWGIKRDKSRNTKDHAVLEETMMNALQVLANKEDYEPDEYDYILKDEVDNKDTLEALRTNFAQLREGLVAIPSNGIIGFAEGGGGLGWQPSADKKDIDALRAFLKQAGFDYRPIDDGVFAYSG